MQTKVHTQTGFDIFVSQSALILNCQLNTADVDWLIKALFWLLVVAGVFWAIYTCPLYTVHCIWFLVWLSYTCPFNTDSTFKPRAAGRQHYLILSLSLTHTHTHTHMSCWLQICRHFPRNQTLRKVAFFQEITLLSMLMLDCEFSSPLSPFLPFIPILYSFSFLLILIFCSPNPFSSSSSFLSLPHLLSLFSPLALNERKHLNLQCSAINAFSAFKLTWTTSKI